MTILEKILGIILFVANLSFWVFLIVRGIRKEIRNAEGYKAMEADRKANGQPFLAWMTKSWRRKCMIYGIENEMLL